MEQPATRSKLLKSTQLVYTEQKSTYFHKLDDEIVTQSPILSKKKKRQNRMSVMGKKALFGDENNQDNAILPIIKKNKTGSQLKEKKAEPEPVLVHKEDKQEEKAVVEEEQVPDRSMNWAVLEETPTPLQHHSSFPEPSKRRHARMRTLQPSHPDISSKFKFFYTSPDCKACTKMTEFCNQVPPPLETRNASTEPLKDEEALTFARKYKDVLVIGKGGCEKILLKDQFEPTNAVLEKKILNKDGTMKTPMCVIAHSMVVGYNEDIMREALFFGNKSPTSFKRKRKGSLSRPLSTLKRTKN